MELRENWLWRKMFWKPRIGSSVKGFKQFREKCMWWKLPMAFVFLQQNKTIFEFYFPPSTKHFEVPSHNREWWRQSCRGFYSHKYESKFPWGKGRATGCHWRHCKGVCWAGTGKSSRASKQPLNRHRGKKKREEHVFKQQLVIWCGQRECIHGMWLEGNETTKTGRTH